MTRPRSIALFALTLLALGLFAAAPASAQLRRTGTTGSVQSSRRSTGTYDQQSRSDRYDRSNRANGDWNNNDNEDHDRGRNGKGNKKRGRNGQNSQNRQNTCVDANRDAVCDYAQRGRSSDSRYPDSRYPDSRYPNGSNPTGTGACIDRNGDGRCDSQTGLPSRIPLPFSQVLSSLLIGQ
jgi:hypothetical protein